MNGRKKMAMFMTICMLMTLLVGIFNVGSVSVSAVYPDPNGKYITPTGAGTKNGSSWENAYGFNTTTFNTAWTATPSNGTLYVGSGTYNGATITAGASGQSATLQKHLLGVDTGSGKPIIKGGFFPPNTVPSTKFFTISSGVNNISVENLRIENYYIGVYTTGNSSYINVSDVEIYVTNDGIRLNGGGTETNTLKTSNVTIEDCKFYYYIKTGIRTENRVEDLLVSNCLADAGGQAYWYANNWPVGFSMTCETSTLAERRFTFVDCIGMNSYVDLGTGYWNGDGFTSERGSYDLNFIRCKAFGSTDGGWDSKGTNVTLTDCIAMDNKRNFRFWGTATMTNCLGAYSYRRGGSSSSVGLWSSGTTVANFCTFYNNNGAQVEKDTGTITLNDCIVGANIAGKSLYTGTVTRNRTAEYLVDGSGTNPQINVTDNSYFYGDSNKYNSGLYGSTKGYYYSGTTTLLDDNFNGYASIAAMQAAGWTVNLNNATTPPGTPLLVTTAEPTIVQYLRAVASTSATRTFAPVALTAAGGSSPGKNAKLVVAFDAYTGGGTGASCDYWKVDDSATGSVAVSAGRRAGAGAYIRYSKSIPSSFTGLTIANSITRFTKMKFVIKITDAAGAFLTGGPKVDVYCSNMTTPITGGTDVNMIDTATTKVNRFYIGGAYSSIEVDNLNISLQTT